MKIKNYLFALGLVLIALACGDQWGDHYEDVSIKGDVKPVSNLNVLDYLATLPEYEQFVQAIEDDPSGLAEEMRSDQLMTVWALNNDVMANLDAVIAESGNTKSEILRFHVNNLSYGYSRLKQGLRLVSLMGKYVSIHQIGEGFTASGAEILDWDNFCANGVVHSINEIMTPLPSIYQFIKDLDDDYSIIRDSLLKYTYIEFDPSVSTPIGINSEGNTIYDSVFVERNDLLDSVGVTSEFLQSTFFLPSNDVIEASLIELQQLIPVLSAEDSLKAMDWIKRAVFMDYLVEDYTTEVDWISRFGKVWRTTVQEVAPVQELSNGLLYPITYMHIPNNVMIERFKELASYYEFVTSDKRDEYFTFTNTTAFSVRATDNVTFNHPDAPASWTYKVLEISGDPTDGVGCAVEFTGVRRVVQGGVTFAEPVVVPPGEYTLYMGFRSKGHPFVNIYFNGELVLENQPVTASTPWNYDRSNGIVAPGVRWGGDGGEVANVTVTGDEPVPFKIKVEFSQPLPDAPNAETMQIYHWSLRPSENNY